MYTDTDRFRDVASAFVEAGYITDEGRVIKRGKEASVLCCPAHPSLGADYVALKIYKDQQFRDFRNDARYLHGRVWKRRDVAHLKTSKSGLWVETELRVLDELSRAGVRVPRPYTQIGRAIAMEFVGENGEAAVPLKDVRLPAEDVARVFEEIIDSIDGMLRCGVIHGDLSAFNILYDGEHLVLIDFPQAVRASTHDDPYTLFRRDVENVAAYFERYGAVWRDGTSDAVGPPNTAGDGAAPRYTRPSLSPLADVLWERYYLRTI